ncbi:hypothetical protein HF086_014393 [Spodoptera exigua]|uniref:HTH psq-type domain-containing protein n=1 Tax=Spodoptera exigua TaxID=7107 RepID=A0A922MU07_SPOEX|nr:hypothetical protein HF086_014393 [Spodoptera exigua]
MMDFEITAIQCARQNLENIMVKCCSFHFGQIIYRKIQSSGLAKLYGTDYSFSLEIKCLMALSFLPHSTIPQYFKVWEENCSEKSALIAKWFAENYVVGKNGKPPQFPPSLWSCHDLNHLKLPRTQNNVEAWHHRLNSIVDKRSPGFYELSTILLAEMNIVEGKIQCILNGEPSAKQKKICTKKNDNIETILRNFKMYTELDLLKAIANLRKMPKVKEGKRYSKGYSESELDKALEAIKNGMGKLTAAKKFNIPRATLQFRLSKEFVKSRPSPDTVLSSQEENQLIEQLYRKHSSDPSRVYNGDETNFILCPKNTKVIAPKGEKNVYEVDHAPSKSCITVMFTFGADGDTTPPMIIFPLKRMRPEIRKSVPKEWDGHKSHTTLELSQLCQSLGIILIALYPNATRLLQPADVAAFRPIKVMWRKAVLEWRANNLTKTLLKTDVGSVLDNVLPKLKKSTLINGFKARGLCPFNPDEVDYTKCLMPAKPQRAILDDNSSVNMNYQIFQEIVGPQLIRKMKAQVVAKSVEAEKLFEIYKYLAPKHSAQNSFSLAEPSTNPDEIPESMDCSTDVSDIVIHEDYEVFNQNIAFAHKMEICTSEPTINPEAIFEYQKENVPNDASVNNLDNILIKTTESEIPVSDLPYALSTTNDSSMDRTTKTPEVIFENQKENKPDEDASITPAYCIPSTSRQNVEFVGGEWVLVDITPNENLETQQIQTKLKDFLPIPKTPINKHKQHVSKQHQTCVLTSKEWEDMELKKQQKNIEERRKIKKKRIKEKLG